MTRITILSPLLLLALTLTTSTAFSIGSNNVISANKRMTTVTLWEGAAEEKEAEAAAPKVEVAVPAAASPAPVAPIEAAPAAVASADAPTAVASSDAPAAVASAAAPTAEGTAAPAAEGAAAPAAAASAPAPAPAAGAAAATAKPAAPQGDVNNQAKYGNDLAMPNTYIRCGRCQNHYAITEADLGEKGKGRRMLCDTCGHSWFQTKDRIMTMRDGFELVARPDWEIERVKDNIKDNKAPNYMGDAKMYIGNLPFGCTEKDIFDLFTGIGKVGDVSFVRDDDGRMRGFGFVTMYEKKDGEQAIEKLDGSSVMGRNIAVRASNN